MARSSVSSCGSCLNSVAFLFCKREDNFLMSFSGIARPGKLAGHSWFTDYFIRILDCSIRVSPSFES